MVDDPPADSSSKREVLDKWLQSSDPRWYYFFFDKLAGEQGQESTAVKLAVLSGNQTILANATRHYARQWQQLGGHPEELDSAQTAKFADSLWRKTPLDVSCWADYQQLPYHPDKTEVQVRNNLMGRGGPLPGAEVYQCRLPDAIAYSPFPRAYRSYSNNSCQEEAIFHFDMAMREYRRIIYFPFRTAWHLDQCAYYIDQMFETSSWFFGCPQGPDDETPPYVGGGGGGGGSGGGGDSGGGDGNGENNSGFRAIAPAVTINLQQRLNCFNSVSSTGALYKITLHAHKGVGGGNKPGHAFITLEKSNGGQVQRLSYGFYPVSGLSSASMQHVASAIGDEFGDEYRKSDSRYSLSINAAQFQSVVNKSLNLANQQYHLLYNNCVHYATSVFNVVNPPTGQLGNSGFISPDDLHTFIRNTKVLHPNQQGIETSRIDLLPSTNCN
ncbi:hypothetical protein GCM10017764_30980 [Sphingobacterium griseoflavum]|uniref:DUF4105 domain-containing protein n=1 Tax=Sphingobacterium griseoflavum TaxID=1474952 RepID=A0ABQ3I1N5_9SPHI|nr:hypothetical protein GCM10017764_30980 [Sphingobacterium griseoflavum]